MDLGDRDDALRYGGGGLAVTGTCAVRIRVGSPVGSGKTTLIVALCRALAGRLRIGVVANDVCTTVEADLLRRARLLPPGRIRAVETRGCPHRAVRDDIAANLGAVEDLEEIFGTLDLVLLKSGGDNLTLRWNDGLVDRQIFVLDVAGGDKVPRKGGAGVTDSDLLVLNKTDIAPLVDADLQVMARDAALVRGRRPVLLTSLVHPPGACDVVDWVLTQVTSVRAAHCLLPRPRRPAAGGTGRGGESTSRSG